MMGKEKQIQISESLFVDLIKYHQFGMEEYAQVIQKGLEAKLDALASHDLYTKSKTAPTPEEREAARQAYLDKRGIRKENRWGAGTDGRTVH